MRRIRLLVEYDGTGYRGFQRQPAGHTVQGDLEQALAQVCGHPVAITGAGRTDAGVHALGQVVHFDTTGSIPTERIARAVTGLVDPAIVVRHAGYADASFHARKSAVRRTYEYFMAREAPEACLTRYVVHEPLLRNGAAVAMNAALRSLVGRHDFASFQGVGSEVGSTVRTVLEAEVQERGPLLRFRIAADGFLKSMVRVIVGMLVEVGQGRRDPEALAQALAARHRAAAAKTAPPHGLFLVRVDYPDGFPEGTGLRSAPFWS